MAEPVAEKRITGVHPAVPSDTAGMFIRILDEVSGVRDVLQKHLVSCAERHGSISPALVALGQQMSAYANDFSRHGDAHREMEGRMRRLEDQATREEAQRIHERLREQEATAAALRKELDEQAADLATKEAAAAAERKIWGRIIPAVAGLLAGGGGALAGNFIKGMFP